MPIILYANLAYFISRHLKRQRIFFGSASPAYLYLDSSGIFAVCPSTLQPASSSRLSFSAKRFTPSAAIPFSLTSHSWLMGRYRGGTGEGCGGVVDVIRYGVRQCGG